MKNLLLPGLYLIFLFFSAFMLYQSEEETGTLHNPETVTEAIGTGTEPGYYVLRPEYLSVCAAETRLLPAVSVMHASEKEGNYIKDTAPDCTECRNNELCVDGRCISLDIIERESRANFESDCSRTRCGEGEFCIAGNCFQPTRMSMSRSGPCTNVDCGQYNVCYLGACYELYNSDEDRPVQCSNIEDTPNISYPKCDEGEVCYEDRCVHPREAMIDRIINTIQNCGNLQASVPGGCLLAGNNPCRNCGSGEVCVGGHCVGLTPQMGEPCTNQRCPEGSRCLSGFCVNI